MSYSHSSHKVIIEPYCIFCKEPTQHVETHTLTDDSSSIITSPFPTHPKCLKKSQRRLWVGRLFGIAAAAAAGFFLFLLAYNWNRHVPFGESPSFLSSDLSGVLCIGVIVVGGVLWYKINSRVTKELDYKIASYYETHVQASSPPLAEGVEPRPLVVNPSGSGDYLDIQGAILNAQPGTRILVQPGEYYGPITINKQVEIVGDGPMEDIIIRGNNSYCFRMQTYDATLRGLTLKNPSEGYFAVRVVTGRLALEDCDIASSWLSCVGIVGPMSKAIIRRCKIHDSRQNGVFIFEKGQATVEDCDIFGNSYSGVAVQEGGSITIRRCQVHRMGRFGIALWDSKGTAEDCDISDNSYSGVLINDGASTVIRRCKVNRNKGAAIWGSQGVATVEDCDLADNIKGAWQIEDGCEVNQTGNKE